MEKTKKPNHIMPIIRTTKSWTDKFPGWGYKPYCGRRTTKLRVMRIGK